MFTNKSGNRINIKYFYKKAVVFGILLIFLTNIIVIADEVNQNILSPIMYNNQNDTPFISDYLDTEKTNPYRPLSIEWDAQLSMIETSGKNDYVVFGEAPDANDGGSPDAYDEPKPPNPFPPCIYSWFNDSLGEPYDVLLKDYREFNNTNYKEWNLSVLWMKFTGGTSINISWNPNDIDESEYDAVVLHNTTLSLDIDMLEESYYQSSFTAFQTKKFIIQCTVDVEPPEIEDNSPSSGTTGDSFTFNATVDDNLFGSSELVVMVDWEHAGLSDNESMANVAGTNYFTKTITLDNSLYDLSYKFYVEDNAKIINTNQTSVLTASVSDNDNPSLTSDDSDTSGTTGDTFNFNIKTSDNIDVSSVNVSWAHGILGGNYALTESPENTWTGSITLDDNLGDLVYTVQVNDSSDNYVRGAEQSVGVSDNDNPILNDIIATPEIQIIGGFVNITATITDNININSVMVDITGPTGFTPVNTSMILYGSDIYYYNENYTIAGLYNYTIWVEDSSGNSITSAINQFEIRSQYQIREMFVGWNFVSMPFNLSINKENLFVKYNGEDYNWSEATNISGDPIINPFIYGWNGTTYVGTDILHSAQGYWIYSYYVCELWATNVSYRPIDGFITNLSIGWMAVGPPVDFDINKSKLIINFEGSEYNWTEAYNAGIVVNQIYYYDDVSGYQETDKLISGESHWIYSYEECVLRWDTS